MVSLLRMSSFHILILLWRLSPGNSDLGNSRVLQELYCKRFWHWHNFPHNDHNLLSLHVFLSSFNLPQKSRTQVKNSNVFYLDSLWFFKGHMQRKKSKAIFSVNWWPREGNAKSIRTLNEQQILQILIFCG